MIIDFCACLEYRGLCTVFTVCALIKQAHERHICIAGCTKQQAMFSRIRQHGEKTVVPDVYRCVFYHYRVWAVCLNQVS